MRTLQIVIFGGLVMLGSVAWAAPGPLPAAAAPSAGAIPAIINLTNPGGIFGPPPFPGPPTSPGAVATPPAAAPAVPSAYPSPYHSQVLNVPETSPLGPGTGGTPNTPS
jgi:hypothetical protein